MNDPIVNEIRMFRDEHAKSFNYDIKAICDDYRQKHSLYVEKLAQIKRQGNAKEIGVEPSNLFQLIDIKH